MNARQPREVIEGMLRSVEGSESPLDLSLRQALTASAADYFEWMDRREQYRESYRRFFREWDILLCPITIVPAFEHTSLPWSERFVTVDGARVPYGNQLVYPGIATLSGQPATAFPVSRSSDGLPIGLQGIGPYLEDRTSIRFAELLEREIGGFVAPPGFD